MERQTLSQEYVQFWENQRKKTVLELYKGTAKVL